MGNQQNKKQRKKPINKRTKLLLIKIGAAFKRLRKNAGYGNSTEFAISRGIPEGSYGKHEAGVENITLDSLVASMLAHGLSEEDIFNKDFLALGDTSEENIILKNSEGTIINQVRTQVKIASSEEIANQFDDSDILDLHKIMIATSTPSFRKQLLKTIGLKSKTPRFERILTFAINAKWLAQTHPDSPNHPLQKYYTSEIGRTVLRLSQEKQN